MRRIVVLPFALMLASCGSVSTGDPDGGADRPKDAVGSTADAGAAGRDAGAETTPGADGAAADTGGAPDTAASDTGGAAEAGVTEGGASDTGGAPAPVLVTVAKGGTGTGTVTSAPAGIACGADCSEAYAAGTSVTLTAAPDASSTFGGWSGGGCTGTGPCVLTATAAATVTATFTLKTWALTATLAGTGGGTITSAPAGITCGATCMASYGHGTLVTLTATPNATSLFTAWGGACTGSGTCVVTMDQARAVSATFTQQSYGLTVTRTGNGAAASGVTSAPAGIACGNDCSEAYAAGTSVTLTATPGAGATFAGWTGGGCAGTGACVVAINAIVNVSASFTLSQSTLTVLKGGNGTGTVTSAPAGINCGATCSQAVDYGGVVTLTAAPAAGSTFSGWSGGGCNGTGTCVVAVTAATSVTATFSKATHLLTVDFQGASAGSVTISPGGTALTADGSATLATGTAVSLTATPAAGVGFGGWGGACAGFGACAFTLGADTTVTVKFDPPNKIFVTSTTVAPGAIGGLAGADAICSARASAGGVTGTFKAFLGTTGADAWTRLAGARGWARLDGKPFADTVADLMAGRTYYPAILTETGAELPAGQTLVVTGRARGATQTCMDWSSTGGGSFDATWGDPRSGYTTFASNGGTACNNVNTRLYCFEVSRSVSFKPPAILSTGRRAFLSSGNLAGNAGLSAADAQCQSEATTAALPGTYKAMLAGNGTTAASRFAAGGAWFRTDGVQLATTAAELLGGATPLWAALSLRADGLTQEQALAWTGAPTVVTPGTAAGTCNGWAATASMATYMTYGNRMGTDWFGPFTSGDCTESHRVFCFQQ